MHLSLSKYDDWLLINANTCLISMELLKFVLTFYPHNPNYFAQ